MLLTILVWLELCSLTIVSDVALSSDWDFILKPLKLALEYSGMLERVNDAIPQ